MLYLQPSNDITALLYAISPKIIVSQKIRNERKILSGQVGAVQGPLVESYNIQEAMENFAFPDKCSFLHIAMTKSLNKSTIDQQSLQSL